MSVQNEFEQLLKKSDHFSGTINSQREATGNVIAALFAILLKKKLVSPQECVQILGELDNHTGNISTDSSRRHMVAAIRDSLKSLK